MVEDNWLKIWYDLVLSGSIFILLDRRASEVRLGKKKLFSEYNIDFEFWVRVMGFKF